MIRLRQSFLKLSDVQLTAEQAAEVARLKALAAESIREGLRLDAWAYKESANDILERAAGIRRCGSCGRRL